MIGARSSRPRDAVTTGHAFFFAASDRVLT